MELRDELTDRIFNACMNVLDETPVIRMEAIARVRKEAKIDFATAERYMLELVDLGILNYQQEKYSLG